MASQRFANEYGFCELNTLPGCSQVCVSNNAFVYEAFRGKGLGSKNHKLRLKRMKELGYDAAIATVVKGNVREEKILMANGWREVFEFKSKVTGNYVGLWTRTL